MKNVKLSPHNTQSAFTMIELIFVIVVLGILASLAMPRLERDTRQQAADNILSAIRYTQHLALNDNKTNPNSDTWQMTLWKIQFVEYSDNYRYRIGSDANEGGAIDKNESAIDPLNGKYMYNNSLAQQSDESSNVFLSDQYGITDIDISGGCGIASGVSSALQIAFDNFGRPFRGISVATNDYGRYVNQDCNITFTAADAFPSDPIIVTIEKETGYVSIVGQEDL